MDTFRNKISNHAQAVLMVLSTLAISIICTNYKSSLSRLGAIDESLGNGLSHSQSRLLEGITKLAQTQASNQEQLMARLDDQGVANASQHNDNDDMVCVLLSLGQDGLKLLISLLCLFRGLALYASRFTGMAYSNKSIPGSV